MPPPLCAPPLPDQELVRRVRNARAEYGVEPARRIPAIVVAADASLLAAAAEESQVLCALARLDPSQLKARPPFSHPRMEGRDGRKPCTNSHGAAPRYRWCPLRRRPGRVRRCSSWLATALRFSFLLQASQARHSGLLRMRVSGRSFGMVLRSYLSTVLAARRGADPVKESARLGKQAAKLEAELAGAPLARRRASRYSTLTTANETARTRATSLRASAGITGRLASPNFSEKAPKAVVDKARKPLHCSPCCVCMDLPRHL